MVTRRLIARALLFASLCAPVVGATSCASDCDDLASHIDNCFAALDCNARVAGSQRDACTDALQTYTSSGSVVTGDECADGNELFAERCKDSVSPETNCACTF